MKKLSLRINGEFQHSFIYSGILFLIDFNKCLLAYQWENLLNDAISKLDENSKNVYKKIFSNKKYNNKKYNINEKLNFKSVTELSNIKQDVLNKHLFKDEVRDINDYPTDINIKNDTLFYSSEKGLLKLQFHWENNKNHPKINFLSSDIKTLFSDCKIFNFSHSSSNRVLLCAGKNGLFDSKYNTNKLNELKVNDQDKNEIWLDSQYYMDKGEQCVLLSNGSSIRKVIDIETNKYIRTLNRINKISKNKKLTCSRLDIFVKNAKSKLEKDFFESNDSILHQLEKNLILMNEDFNYRDYSYIKERKVNNLKANIIQLNDTLFYQSQIDNSLTKLTDDCVSWRVFPNATSHFNHCHIIHDDYIEIVGFDK